jgi:hypothetical protein
MHEDDGSGEIDERLVLAAAFNADNTKRRMIWPSRK